MLYNAFQSARHPKSAPSGEGVYIPIAWGCRRKYNKRYINRLPLPFTFNACPLDPPNSASQNASQSIVSSAVFAQLMAESPYTLQCALKCT